MSTPKVSVCITTYNHEAFLGPALDSVLSQHTTFDFEIVVGEDNSSDGTRAVLERYAAENDCIVPLYRDGKDKIYVDGKPTGRRNLIDILERRVTGDYVAMLDGDDYWTDSGKLQQQVDALEADQTAAIAAHRIVSVGPLASDVEFPRRKLYPAGRYSTLDLIRGNFLPTASIVFRRQPGFVFPAWIHPLPYADWPLHLHNSRRGDIILLDDVMAARREHDGGRWSGMQARERYRHDIRFLETYRSHARPEHLDAIENSVRSFQLRALREIIEHESTADCLNFYRAAEATTGRPIALPVLIAALGRSHWKKLRKRLRSSEKAHRGQS